MRPGINRRAIDLILDRFDNVSFDVLLGVPGRTVPSLDRTISGLARLRPAHFSVYCLEPGGDMAAQVEGFFAGVDADGFADEYLIVCRRLGDGGYGHYEVSNFARPGRESRHNRVYWDGGDYLGVGPAAHSCLGGERFHNPPSLATYVESARRPGVERWIRDETGRSGPGNGTHHACVADGPRTAGEIVALLWGHRKCYFGGGTRRHHVGAIEAYRQRLSAAQRDRSAARSGPVTGKP